MAVFPILDQPGTSLDPEWTDWQTGRLGGLPTILDQIRQHEARLIQNAQSAPAGPGPSAVGGVRSRESARPDKPASSPTLVPTLVPRRPDPKPLHSGNALSPNNLWPRPSRPQNIVYGRLSPIPAGRWYAAPCSYPSCRPQYPAFPPFSPLSPAPPWWVISPMNRTSDLDDRSAPRRRGLAVPGQSGGQG